jgi:hypothetical protein
MFMETLEACGLNKYLFEMANIRNQNSWIHSKSAGNAPRDKAKDLVRMAVARAGDAETVARKMIISVNQRGLVIGGGIAGMNAALNLGTPGFSRWSWLKRRAMNWAGLPGTCATPSKAATCRPTSQKLICRDGRPMIVGGSGDRYDQCVRLRRLQGQFRDHRSPLAAGDAREHRPRGDRRGDRRQWNTSRTEYLYGEDDRVATQVELAKTAWRTRGAGDVDSVVMIQCVGSQKRGDGGVLARLLPELR